MCFCIALHTASTCNFTFFSLLSLIFSAFTNNAIYLLCIMCFIKLTQHFLTIIAGFKTICVYGKNISGSS